MSKNLIKLESVDGQIIDVDIEIAKQMKMIEDMLDFGNIGTEDPPEVAVPVGNVKGTILKKVVEWLIHHKDDPPTSEKEFSELRTDDIPEWDKEFLNVEDATLYEIVTAADFLNVKGLMEVGCKTVANRIKVMTPDELRKIFVKPNIPSEAV